eukprot:14530477-Ditylum_brightwellii.AAC.1
MSQEMTHQKAKEEFCNYHGLCHHDTDEFKYVCTHRKHAHPIHCIMEEQRLSHICFVKDAKICTKKPDLNAKEVKNLNALVNGK